MYNEIGCITSVTSSKIDGSNASTKTFTYDSSDRLINEQTAETLYNGTSTFRDEKLYLLKYWERINMFFNWHKKKPKTFLSDYDRLKHFKKYDFEIIDLSNDSCISICLLKNHYCIVYHMWPQFGDFNIFITNTIEDYLKHKYIRSYGQNWFVENVAHEYEKERNNKHWKWLDLVEFYLQSQIDKGARIFDVVF